MEHRLLIDVDKVDNMSTKACHFNGKERSP